MKNYARDQAIALSLTIVTCAVLIGLLLVEVRVLNIFTTSDITIHLRLADVLIGLTVYLKTSIDFAIFIARLMDKNPGLKGRIGIEIGTAFGNAIGTMAVLLLWTFFKEVNWLLAAMVLLASLVLLRLAEDSMEHIKVDSGRLSGLKPFVNALNKFLGLANKFIDPFLSKIVPSHTLKVTVQKGFGALFLMSFTVPFILGLDDFAGYVPLFSIVNVFGFGVGVLLGHMLLNISLYISPERTTRAVKNPVIALLGAIAFIGLAGWGLVETVRLLFLHG